MKTTPIQVRLSEEDLAFLRSLGPLAQGIRQAIQCLRIWTVLPSHLQGLLSKLSSLPKLPK